MPDKGQLVEKQNVSMYPSDWGIVDGADTGDAGRSATLRRIVREWHEWRGMILVDKRSPYVIRESEHGKIVNYTSIVPDATE